MDVKHCSGCRNNFYNMERSGCWSLGSAELKTRYRIHMDAPMNVKSNFKAEVLPSCYTTGGYSSPSQTTIVDKVPRHAS